MFVSYQNIFFRTENVFYLASTFLLKIKRTPAAARVCIGSGFAHFDIPYLKIIYFCLNCHKCLYKENVSYLFRWLGNIR